MLPRKQDAFPGADLRSERTMHALSLARQRLQAHLQSSTTPVPVRLAHGMVSGGKGRYLPLLSSALAQSILSDGYDARTLERVYRNRPSGDMGPLGLLADRMVLDLPVHQALRERLEAVVGELCSAVTLGTRSGISDFRVLSAPCGLADELIGAGERLRRSRPVAFAALRCWGVDADLAGDLLPEATRRARALSLPMQFIREDLRRRREVSAVVAAQGPFHSVLSLGLAQRFTATDAAELVRFYSGLMAPNGVLIADRWERTDAPKLAAGLGVDWRYQNGGEFREMLQSAGLRIEREHPSGEGGCVVVVARKP
jgi:hypothetical protein